MEYSAEYLAAARAAQKEPTAATKRAAYNRAVAQECSRNNAQVPVKGKKVKHVFIEATFPELKGGASRQSAHGEASGTKPAIARAFKNLLKTIPKKRISVISAKISITTKIVEDDRVKV
jgi:hypothetical protein